VPPVEYATAVAPPAAPPSPWREWVTALVDLLLPPVCPVCRSRLGPGRRDPLCGTCWAALDRIAAPVCRLCGIPFARFAPAPADVGHLCAACRRRRPPFAYARAAARYGDVAREAIHAFKFGQRRSLAAPLGDLLAETGVASLPAERVDLLLPVPLHPRRERERGFNQATLLARRLGQRWDRPVASGVLIRRVATSPQTALAADERRGNVRGAFTVARPEAIRGRDVLLIDDIMTTGATAGECATCLRRAGAASVGVLTVARVI